MKKSRFCFHVYHISVTSHHLTHLSNSLNNSVQSTMRKSAELGQNIRTNVSDNTDSLMFNDVLTNKCESTDLILLLETKQRQINAASLNKSHFSVHDWSKTSFLLITISH